MIPVTSLKDFYKVAHPEMFPDGTICVYSNFTPRKSRVKNVDKVVNFGLQYVIKDVLIKEYNETFFNIPEDVAVSKYKRRMDTSLGKDVIKVERIRELHQLQYLPIVIKSLPEGMLVDMKVPLFTIKNTLPQFYWLTNDLETILSCELWKITTNATTAHEYKKLCVKYADETCDSRDHVEFQCHNFSFRGMSGRHDAASTGAAHALSFVGNDTISAADWLEDYYNANADEELLITSIPATEHSVMCMGTKDGEFETYRRLIFDVYPKGLVGIVSDTWSLENVVENHLRKLRNAIDERPGKVVIRPDSGDPVKILTGYFNSELLKKSDTELYTDDSNNFYSTNYEEGDTKPITPFYRRGLIESLWDIFGGTVNSKGYKVLNPCIGAIYGDSITLDRAEDIFKRLKAKGFASSNVVLGIGSYTYQYVTRDTYGMAMKATYGEIEIDVPNPTGQLHEYMPIIDKREIYKDPETDDGTKKSAKGLLHVAEILHVDSMGKLTHDRYELFDQADEELEQLGALKEVFRDGKLLIDHNFKDVKSRLAMFI